MCGDLRTKNDMPAPKNVVVVLWQSQLRAPVLGLIAREPSPGLRPYCQTRNYWPAGNITLNTEPYG